MKIDFIPMFLTYFISSDLGRIYQRNIHEEGKGTGSLETGNVFC